MVEKKAGAKRGRSFKGMEMSEEQAGIAYEAARLQKHRRQNGLTVTRGVLNSSIEDIDLALDIIARDEFKRIKADDLLNPKINPSGPIDLVDGKIINFTPAVEAERARLRESVARDFPEYK